MSTANRTMNSEFLEVNVCGRVTGPSNRGDSRGQVALRSASDRTSALKLAPVSAPNDTHQVSDATNNVLDGIDLTWYLSFHGVVLHQENGLTEREAAS